MLESCFIALLGGCGGLAIAWLITASGNPIPSVIPVFYMPANTLITGSLFALALGIVAGVIPAFQAMQLKIAEALRRGG